MIHHIVLLLLSLVPCISKGNKLIPIPPGNNPFFDGMHSSPTHSDASMLAEQLYNWYIVEDFVYEKEPRIPKKIHQIWIGPNPLPPRCKEFQKTWKKFHPDWEYKLWNDQDIEEFGLQNKHLYDQSKNYGQRADIARYEILYRQGGLYIDTDFECLKPFDVLHHGLDFYVTTIMEGGFRVSNAIIGSVAHHPILKTTINEMSLRNILQTTGPLYFTRCFLKSVQNSGRSIAFPSSYLFPLTYNEFREVRKTLKRTKNINERRKRESMIIKEHIHPQTYAIHYFYGLWYKNTDDEVN